MDRKRSLVIAGSIALSGLAAGTAMAANLGLLSAADDGPPVGNLDASNVSDLADAVPVAEQSPAADTTSTTAGVVVVEEWITEPGAAPSGAAPGGTPAPTDPLGAPLPQPGATSGPGAPAGSQADGTTSPAPNVPRESSPSTYRAEPHEWEEHEWEEHEEEHEEEEHEEEEEEEREDDDHEHEHEEEDD